MYIIYINPLCKGNKELQRIIIKEGIIMLMQPEEARQRQIDIRERKEAQELERICEKIKENLEEGESTKIYKSSVK